MMNYNQPYYALSQEPYVNRYNMPYINQQLKAFFVSNKDEANATPIDVSGNPNFFYNRGLNEIYVKQFDVKTGITTFQKFVKTENETEEKSDPYKEQFDLITKRLDEMQEKLEQKDVKNAK